MTSTFHPTCWTLVLRARGEGEEAAVALSDLCAGYYAPVVAFLRREGRDEDAARELAHAFFERVLADGVGAPEPGRGRFRSYLLGALKHFLSNRRAAGLAAKRGGGVEHGELLEETAAASGPPPEELFDREWAFTLIGRALERLEAEHAGRVAQFAVLKPWLSGDGGQSQTEAADALGLSTTAVKVAIHRLRARFRELIRSEIAATVHDPADAADELRHLIEIAARG